MGIISVASLSYKLALRKIKHLIWTNQIHEVTEKSDFSWQHYLLSLRLSICFRFCWRWQILNQNTESETNPYDNLMRQAGLSRFLGVRKTRISQVTGKSDFTGYKTKTVLLWTTTNTHHIPFKKSCNMIIFPLRKRSPCFNVIISQNQYLTFLSLVSSNFLGVKDRVADSDVYICHPSTAWIPKPEWVKSNLLNIASAYFAIKKTNIAMHCINLFFKTSSVWNYRLCT